jgi:uncharacterized protein YunC (DUF1805 family)
MINTREIKVNNTTVQGVEIQLPNAVLVIAAAKNGFVMCGYLNIDAAERFNDPAAIVKGVKNIDELFAGKVVAVTSAAKKLGVREGLTGAQALYLFSK